MKTIDVHEAQASLRQYAEEVKTGEALVLTEDGTPIAALVPITDNFDEENLALGSNPEFLAFLEEARRSGDAIPHDEFWRQVDDEVARKASR